MSDQKKLEKYKSGRALIAAGIPDAKEFFARRTGPIISPQDISDVLAAPVPGVPSLSGEELIEKRKAGLALIAAGIPDAKEFFAGRTGPVIVAKELSDEPTVTPGMIRTMGQKYRMLREQRNAELSEEKIIPDSTE
jgi:hypothetical protein